jgi:putative redox protein
MAKVRGSIQNRNYKTILQHHSHQIVADEPTSLGGEDKGMSPTALLASSLSACSCITMKMYANRKGWEINDILVEVHVKIDIKTGDTYIVKHIKIDAPISNDDKSRLFKISSACPIHKLLAKSTNIESILVG